MKRSLLITYLLIFACALAIRLWFALYDGHLDASAVCDSSEYLRDAAALSKLLSQPPQFFFDSIKYLFGSLDAQSAIVLKEQYKSIEEMVRQAGSVYPAFLILGYALTGHAPDGYSVTGPIILQCLISAITCVFIGLTAGRCFSPKVGITAAILAVFYPGFIVNCVRVLSENLAAFLISAVALLTVNLIQETKNKVKPYLACALGICLALLQMTRPAMILVLIPVSIFLLWRMRSSQRDLVKISVFALTGFALAILPPMCLQKLSMGTASFMPDRQKGYNLCIGLDTYTKGWIAYPFFSYMPLKTKSSTEIITQEISASPAGFFQLMLDKPARLLKSHWNDFRLPIGTIPMSDQIFFHQLVLMLSSVGIALCLFGKSDSDFAGNKFACRIFLLSLICVHGAYFIFSTLPRYGLTAMPFLIMFAAGCLHILFDLIKNNATRKYGLALVGSALLLLIILRFNAVGVLRALPGVTHFNTASYVELALRMIAYVLFVDLLFRISKNCHNISSRSRFSIVLLAPLLLPFTIPHLPVHGRPNEWKITLEPKFDTLTQEIELPKDRIADLQSRDCFLIIDCQNWHNLGQNATISVDGQKLESPIFPLMPFVQNLRQPQKQPDNKYYFEMENLFSWLLVGTGGTLPDLRQWYAVALPPSLIANSSGKEKATLKIEIKNRPGRNQKNLYFGTYVPKRHQVIIPGLRMYSWDKGVCGVERLDQFSDSRFDEKYQLTNLSEGNKDLSPDAGFQSGTYNIRILAAPKSVPAVQQFKTLQSSEPTTSKDLKLDVNLKRQTQYDRQSIWIVTFKGVLDSTQTNSFSIPVDIEASVTAGEKQFISRFTPSSIQVQKGSNPIEFSFPLVPSGLGSPVSSIDLKVKEGGRAKSNQFFGCTNYTAAEIKGLSWRDCVITVSEIRKNPIIEGCEVY